MRYKYREKKNWPIGRKIKQSIETISDFKSTIINMFVKQKEYKFV